ncbi:MAG: hypothetical protein AAFY16_02305 [Cyanobacteria bacterium J06642_3]
MHESSRYRSNQICSQQLTPNFSTKNADNSLSDEIDTNNKPEFQDLVNQMILNLIAKTEAELITISTITQKYREIAVQKIN